jgi:tetratricopeptide (TPR) repeat protein
MLLEATFTPTPYYVNTPHAVSEAYRIGQRAIQNQEWENADNFFRQAATDVAKSDPGSVDVLFYIAENLRLQGSLNDALEIYNQVIQQSPEFAPAYVGRARVRIAQNPEKLVDAAIGDLQIAVKNDPQYAEAYLELAAQQLQAGKAQDVLDTLDSAPDPLLADLPLTYLYRAQAQILLKDYPNALASARRANEMDITLLPAYRIIGEVLQINGEVEASVKPLTTYLTYEQDDALAWALLADAYFSAGEQAEAFKALDRALSLNNRLPRAYLQRALIEMEMDDAEKALADFQAALRLDPTSYESSLGIGQALMALNYPGDAWDRFERTKTLSETELQKAELTFWRAQSLERLGELDAAMRDYQALIEFPVGSVKNEWVQFAQKRIAALSVETPSATPKLPTPTVSKTGTRQPSRTPTPTPTKKP